MHLDESLIDQPEAAINSAQAEIKGVVGLTERIVGTLVRPFVNSKNLTDIEDSDLDFMSGTNQRIEKIGFLNQKINDYLIAVSYTHLTLPTKA